MTIHLLIIAQHSYTLFTTPTTLTTLYHWTPSSFTHLVYLATTLFHVCTLLANILKLSRIERAFVLYGTWIVWSGWAICLSLIERNEIKMEEEKSWELSPEREGDEFVIDELKGSELPPFLIHSDWTSTFFPILSFLLLLALRRGHWGLITWEHLVLLEATSHLKWYRIWCLSGASAGWILFWEGVKYYFHITLIYRTDLTAFPGIAGTVWTNLWSGMLLAMWWSFWTFQYRGVVWKRELLEGVAVWSDDDGWVRVGGVGQQKLG
ncbi:3539_t:CDS:1 [Paraglomus brasilianum]|uniref:3539_t:CDS:1 n=1 Tax=Paraglomus brasilianum TaxID=144538 RepID=A0A9N8ZXN9_9GLOM|nr:3539_t:CDS:1 [Paraglomus brasilianum]